MTYSSTLLAALLLATVVTAESGPYGIVRDAKSFAIGGVGITGVTSPAEHAYRELRNGPKADEQFRKLLRDASPAGQMYALFGLRQIEAADYAAVSEPFRKSATPVEVISGCIIHRDSISNVVKWIDQWARRIRGWEKP